MRKASKTTKKIMAAIAAAAVSCGIFTGCASVKAASEEQEVKAVPVSAEEVREEIVIAMESEPPTLHPFDHKAVTAGYMNNLTFNCLFTIDVDTLKPVPALCKSYENISESQWVFTIYDDIYFHDGSHMTAEDVKASMEWARTYPTTKDYTSFWTNIEVADEYTVRVTTDGPYALTLYNLTNIKIVPKALIESGHDFAASPIGSGPYKFVSQTLGESVVFEKFDEYFDEEHEAKIEDMTWRIIPEGSSRSIALEAGEVDVVIEVDSNDIKRMEEAENINVYKTPGTRLNFMCMNSEEYPFTDKNFRKAMNAAIDREAVITVACNGEGTKAVSQTPMVFEGASEAGSIDRDTEKAKEYLAMSSVDPETVVFSCIVANDTARRTAEVIQANLQEIGVSMEIENMDYATQLTAIMSGDYEASIIGFTQTNMCMYMAGLFHSDAIDAANLSRISDPFVDEMIDLSKTQIDDEERAETLRQVTEYLNEWSPFVSLYQTVVTRAASAELQGFKVSASGQTHFEDVYRAE